MSKYSPEYLLEVAKSARFPYHEPDDGRCTWEAKDGWHVRVFYKRGRFMYLDSLVSNVGEIIDAEEVPYNDPGMPGRDPEFCNLVWWEPDESQYTDRQPKSVTLEMGAADFDKVKEFKERYIIEHGDGPIIE
jgi:hypothetical protein